MGYHIITDCANLGMICCEDGTYKLEYSTMCNSINEVRQELMRSWFNDNHLSTIDDSNGQIINSIINKLENSNGLIKTGLTGNRDCCQIFIYVSSSATISLTKDEAAMIFPSINNV